MSRGAYKLAYEVAQGWDQLPEGWAYTEVVGVGVDSRDRVYLFTRGEHPVIVYDKEGRFLTAWGEGRFVRPHGVYVSGDDRLFLVDDLGHAVHRFGLEGGEPELTLGDGTPADTGYAPNEAPVARAAGPFNAVTNVALNRAGEIYAADGYGNARVHKFSADGKLLHSWGEPGSGEGQFELPHGIALDSAGRVYVADRENSRVQVFDGDGNFLHQWRWLNRPADIYIDDQDTIYISELGFIFGGGHVPHLRLMNDPPAGHDPIARVTVTNPDGEILARIGGAGEPILPGNFIAPHGLWADSRGDLYVGEVVAATGAAKHYAPLTPHALQKFVRRG